jgi:translation initiation factor IF-2
MSKVRIHALAKELGVESKRMLEIIAGMGVEAKTASSSIDEETAETIKSLIAEENKPKAKAPDAPMKATARKAEGKAETKPVEAPAQAEAQPDAPVAPTEIKLENTKAEVKPDPKPEAKPAEVKAEVAPKPAPDVSRNTLPHRAPVITIMGHVDHGKTSLLDYIRSTKVAEREAGGITQHVGAFEASTPKGKIMFIDTPGHEAFTSIRARGAQVADIAVIVIAADDSIMPQTREAIAHAKAAKVPIVVAINKIDLPGVNPDKVMQDLTNVNLIPEAYGGDTIVVPISAKTGKGVDDLLENLSLVAELEDLRADPNGDLQGVIIESKIDKQAGVLATVLIQEGTIKVSDFLVVGELYGKIRAMTDSNGTRVTEAGPGSAVQVLGFGQTPVAGEIVTRAANEHAAREVIAERKDTRRDDEDATERRNNPVQRGAAAGMTLEDILGKPGEVKVEAKEVNLILRADTQGSLEALEGILARESNDDVVVNVMFAGIGSPTEGDVLLASTADARIMAFNTTAPGSVQKMAENKKLEIKSYRIIYELIDDVKKMMRGNTGPVMEDRVIGKAEVRMVIPVPRTNGNIAGSYVTEGKVLRGAKVRILRKNKEIHRGQISGLKRFKDDAREVLQGYECGINVSNFDNYEVGDILEISETVEVPQTA